MAPQSRDVVESIDVLYVTADADVAAVVQTTLADVSPGLEVRTVGTAEEALEQIEARPIDCVVTEYALPDGTGTDLIETIDAEGLPAILFTDQHSEQVAREAVDANAAAYIPSHDTENSVEVLGWRIQAVVEAGRPEHRADEREQELERKRSEAILRNIRDIVFVLDDEGVVAFANSTAGRELAGRESDQIVGNPLTEALGDRIDDADTERLSAAITSTVQGPEHAPSEAGVYDTGVEIDIERGDETRTYDVCFTPFEAAPSQQVLAVARDITEQVERARTLEMTNQRLESLIDATPLSVIELDADGHVLRWNDEAERVFGWAEADIVGEYCPIIPDDYEPTYRSNLQTIMNGGWVRGKEVQRTNKNGRTLDMLLSAGPVTDPDGEVNSVLAVLDNITEQKQLERSLRSLQQTAQRLSRAQSRETIGQIGVDAVIEILGYEIAGIWKYTDQTDALIPLADSPDSRDVVGELPRFEPGESLAWESFETGEIRVYDDLQSHEPLANPDTPIKSEILVPLGEYGLIATGSLGQEHFSETDVDLFRILGSTLEAAFGRASREARLKRQNERLDQFASVVSHDLRNPLKVASGYTDLAKETGDPAHFEHIADAHARMERLIDDLLTLARGETTVTDAVDLDLGTIAREAWGYVETHEAELAVADDLPVVAGDGGRLTQLFENLFRNAVEHGGSEVTVTVGRLDQTPGFYVEDDGDGIPPGNRESVFDHGVTSSDAGTGFGLSIVAEIVKAHGWTVSVTDGTAGGARFEFETPTTETPQQ